MRSSSDMTERGTQPECCLPCSPRARDTTGDLDTLDTVDTVERLSVLILLKVVRTEPGTVSSVPGIPRIPTVSVRLTMVSKRTRHTSPYGALRHDIAE